LAGHPDRRLRSDSCAGGAGLDPAEGDAFVGVVTGVAEVAAVVLRLLSGPLAHRSRRFWAWTIAGYALTVGAVPMLGLFGVLWVASALVIAERVGKAVRSPAKETLLPRATAAGSSSPSTRRWTRSEP